MIIHHIKPLQRMSTGRRTMFWK